MNLRRKLLFFLYWLIHASVLFGQVKTSDKRVSILPVPTIGFSPETDLYFGAVALGSFRIFGDSTVRSSNASLEFNYSLRNQLILSGDWNFFGKREAWFSKGFINFSRYPDQYFGASLKQVSDTGIWYDSDRASARIHLLKQVKSHYYAGVVIGYQSYSNLKGDYINQFEELKNSSVVDIGIHGLFDSRNNLLNSTSGSFFEFVLRSGLSSDNYFRLNMDFRKFYSFKEHILSFRLLQESCFGSTPFYDLALLGGDEKVRGYFRGRYRDNHLQSLQLEYKSPYLWRFALALFGGSSNTASQINTLNSRPLLWNYGVGLRFLSDKKERINLRFDYALGSDGLGGFYVAFGESF